MAWNFLQGFYAKKGIFYERKGKIYFQTGNEVGCNAGKYILNTLKWEK